LDLNEHALSESQRTLKRLGITHVLLPPPVVRDGIHTSSPRTETSPQGGAQGSPEQPVSPASADILPPLVRSLFHGKHVPIRSMWTYAGLYEDMQQAETPARLGVFKKIQASVCLHLKWASTDIGAWPLDVTPQIFRKGVEYFCPRTVIFFCGSTPPTANIEEALAFMKQSGCRVITLPNLEEMALGNQQLKNEAWKILQTVPD